jgi:hypothetical protein
MPTRARAADLQPAVQVVKAGAAGQADFPVVLLPGAATRSTTTASNCPAMILPLR